MIFTCTIANYLFIFGFSLGVMVCGFDCIFNATYMSPSKIVCKTGFGLGNGEVIVTTKSGGEGTCTVTFLAYVPDRIGKHYLFILFHYI